MSLSHLLAAGRSVRNIKSGPSRYRMTQQNLLPKFGTKRMDGTRFVKEPSRTVETAPEPARAESVVSTTTVLAEEICAAPSEPEPARAAVFAEEVKKLRPFGNWSLFRNPFGKTPARKSEAGPAQTELLLDLVKPVRNDLSDADSTVGRVVRQPEPVSVMQTEPVVVPQLPAREERGLWRRLKTRLLGAAGKP